MTLISCTFKIRFKEAVGNKKGNDPVAICPKFLCPVIDLRRGAVGFLKFAAKEIGVIPVASVFFVIPDEGSVRFPEFFKAGNLFTPVGGIVYGVAAGVYLVAVEQEEVFELRREFGFDVLEEIDLGSFVGKAVLANESLHLLPVVAGYAESLFRIDGCGPFIT